MPECISCGKEVLDGTFCGKPCCFTCWLDDDIYSYLTEDEVTKWAKEHPVEGFDNYGYDIPPNIGTKVKK